MSSTRSTCACARTRAACLGLLRARARRGAAGDRPRRHRAARAASCPTARRSRCPSTTPSRCALDVPADMKGELVCLAVPLAREGVTQVGFDGAEAHELRRWRADSEELRDHTNAADEPEAVQTGALDLRLVRAKEAGDGYALLGVARVIERRSDNQVVLDPLYIAPQTRIDATPAALGARDAAARPDPPARARIRGAHGPAQPRHLGDGRLPHAAGAQPRRAGVSPACAGAATRTRRSSTSPACSSPATCRPSPARRAFRASTRRIATTICRPPSCR